MDQRPRLTLELVPPEPNALRHQTALLREPLDRLPALSPCVQNAARLVLGPLTSVCHAGRARSLRSDPRDRIADRTVTFGVHSVNTNALLDRVNRTFRLA